MQGNLFVNRKYFTHYKIHNHPPSCPMETPFLLKCCHLHFSIKNKRKKRRKMKETTWLIWQMNNEKNVWMDKILFSYITAKGLKTFLLLFGIIDCLFLFLGGISKNVGYWAYYKKTYLMKISIFIELSTS